MRPIFYATLFFGSLCVTSSAPDAASVYLWTDENSRMHITEAPPPQGGMVRDVFEYEPHSEEPRAAEPSPRPEGATSETENNEVQCRIVFKARQTLRKKKSVAAAVRKRASETRDKVQNLRDQIGFDDDRRDDFKDDLKRLEESARRAEMFVQQAALDVRVAELQVQIAEMEAGGPCPEKRGFY